MSDLKSFEKQGKKIKELAKRIAEKKISLEELNELSELLHEMNDKVAVLKYFLAKNDFDMKSVEIQKEEILAQAPEPVNIIVEEPKEEVVEEKEPEKEETPAFSFSLFEEEDETVLSEEQEDEAVLSDEQEQVLRQAQEPEESDVKVSVSGDSGSSLNDSLKGHQESGSLNDNYFGSQDDSLANKLKNTPIQNLKSAIGINVKFTFINELFGGNADDFAKTVDAIDMMNSADDARGLLSELSSANNWDLESKPVSQFVEMVERRFM